MNAVTASPGWSRRRMLFAVLLLVLTLAEVTANGTCGGKFGPHSAALMSIHTSAPERATGA